MYAERPGTNATPLLRAIRSVVSTPSSVAHTNSPPSGRVHDARPPKCSASDSSITSRRRRYSSRRRSTYSIQAGVPAAVRSAK